MSIFGLGTGVLQARPVQARGDGWRVTRGVKVGLVGHAKG